MKWNYYIMKLRPVSPFLASIPWAEDDTEPVKQSKTNREKEMQMLHCVSEIVTSLTTVCFANFDNLNLLRFRIDPTSAAIQAASKFYACYKK